jgi:hypothetical protein
MIATRLAQLSTENQDHLRNGGYAASDAAIRARYEPLLKNVYGTMITPPTKFPLALGLCSHPVI